MKRAFMSTLMILVSGLLTLSIFQNCSPSHSGSATETDTFSMTAVYPYLNAKPTYFDNIQLTDVVNDSGVWRYQFVAGIVYIDDPTKNIDYQINITDEDDNLLCLSKTGRINSSSNHIMIDNCNSSNKAEIVRIKVRAKLATESTYSVVSDYDFEL